MGTKNSSLEAVHTGGCLQRIYKKTQSWQRPTLPPPTVVVPLAKRGLTTVFGMETGVAHALELPRLCLFDQCTDLEKRCKNHLQ